MNFDDLNMEKSYDPRKAYAQSKLCNVLFTRELAKQLDKNKVTVNCLHPGVVRTELGRYFSDTLGWKFHLMKLFTPLMLWILKSAKQGAQTTIHCAVSEDVDKVTGVYFSDCKPKALMPHALMDDDAKRLWEISAKLCQL